jgi:uncharacterized protein (TIGR00290 family)
MVPIIKRRVTGRGVPGGDEDVDMTERALFAWSGGKDSAAALYEVRKAGNYEILAMVTTVTEDYDRVSMHGVRRSLLEKQADFLGYPLEQVIISKGASNEEYEAKMRNVLKKYLQAGISSVIFGDLFLENVKTYREENLSKMGIKAVFPIWKRNTTELAHAMVELGFKAVVTCVDSRFLDNTFAGRLFDNKFLLELPSNVDPCGENGEFHTFVYNGPIFREAVPFEIGNVVMRDDRFYFCDLIPL